MLNDKQKSMKSKTALTKAARLCDYSKAVFYGENFKGFYSRNVEELEHEKESVVIKQIIQTLDIVGTIRLTRPLRKYINILYRKGYLFRVLPDKEGIVLWRMKDKRPLDSKIKELIEEYAEDGLNLDDIELIGHQNCIDFLGEEWSYAIKYLKESGIEIDDSNPEAVANYFINIRGYEIQNEQN